MKYTSPLVLVVILSFLVGSASASTKARIMAANISSGAQQSYDPGHGIRMFKGLKPDVALIQEFNYGRNNDEDDVKDMVTEAFGAGFHVCRDEKESAAIPNGVVSRFPIAECGGFTDSEINNREYTYAKISLPGNKTLWAFSLHLKSGSASDRRANEGRELVGYVRSKVGPSDYLVLGGDFNTKSRDEQVIRILKQVIVDTHIPVGMEGKPGTNATRRAPYDLVLPNAALDRFHVAVQIGPKSFPHGLVFDSRTFSPLSLVAPVEADDSAAEGMQHMPVIKDFLLPD